MTNCPGCPRTIPVLALKVLLPGKCLFRKCKVPVFEMGAKVWLEYKTNMAALRPGAAESKFYSPVDIAQIFCLLYLLPDC